MGGEIDGTFMRIATDLTSVINSNDMRVVPIVGKGSLQNIGDLLHLPGVDLALIAADVLAYAQAAHLYPGELGKVQYICKLYDNDVHVCARPEIQSMADLQGKPVNIDVEGAGTNLTARAVFRILGIAPDFRTDEPTIGQDKLRRGEIAANVYLGGKPIRLFATSPADTGLHFIPVQSNEALEKTYLPGGLLTHAEYPNLVPADQPVETIGVGVTLAVFGWTPGSTRYRNLVAFVDTFFSKFPELLKPPHHPAWHNVNLAAAQPGWLRFPPAEAWLAQHRPPPHPRQRTRKCRRSSTRFSRNAGSRILARHSARQPGSISSNSGMRVGKAKYRRLVPVARFTLMSPGRPILRRFPSHVHPQQGDR